MNWNSSWANDKIMNNHSDSGSTYEEIQYQALGRNTMVWECFGVQKYSESN